MASLTTFPIPPAHFPKLTRVLLQVIPRPLSFAGLRYVDLPCAVSVWVDASFLGIVMVGTNLKLEQAHCVFFFLFFFEIDDATEKLTRSMMLGRNDDETNLRKHHSIVVAHGSVGDLFCCYPRDLFDRLEVWIGLVWNLDVDVIWAGAS
jgi:hypothetical protein